MSTETKMMHIPETLSNWPWKRAINPHYEEVKTESDAWLRSFKPFSPRSQYACEMCKCCLLSALTYPLESREHFRTTCDLMYLFFVVDEYTDAEDASGVRAIVDIVLDAINNPSTPRPQGEVVVGEIARQFWERAIKTASAPSQRHFIESFTAYLNSVIEQANDRDDSSIRTIESYLSMRRENIGTRPSFALLELSLELSDDVIYHPRIVELALYVTDMIIIGNDLVSYNKEQASGDDQCNILTVVMHQLNMDLDRAIRWAVDYHADAQKKFIEGVMNIPTWGYNTDRQVERYLHGLANWVRGDNSWSFESARYFGSKGPDIQKTRFVPLLPRKSSPARQAALRRENVVIPLIEDLAREDLAVGA